MLIDSKVLSTNFLPFFLLPPDFFLVGVMIGLLGDMIIEVVTGEVMVVVTMGAQMVDVEIRVCGWVTIKF